MEFHYGDFRGRIEVVTGEELEHFLWHLRGYGIQAIIEMRYLVGKRESFDTAAFAWDHMDWEQRHKTLLAYTLLHAEGDHVLMDPKILRTPNEYQSY